MGVSSEATPTLPRPFQKQMRSVDEGSEVEAYPTTTALPRSNTSIGGFIYIYRGRLNNVPVCLCVFRDDITQSSEAEIISSTKRTLQ